MTGQAVVLLCVESARLGGRAVWRVSGCGGLRSGPGCWQCGTEGSHAPSATVRPRRATLRETELHSPDLWDPCCKRGSCLPSCPNAVSCQARSNDVQLLPSVNRQVAVKGCVCALLCHFGGKRGKKTESRRKRFAQGHMAGLCQCWSKTSFDSGACDNVGCRHTWVYSTRSWPVLVQKSPGRHCCPVLSFFLLGRKMNVSVCLSLRQFSTPLGTFSRTFAP